MHDAKLTTLIEGGLKLGLLELFWLRGDGKIATKIGVAWGVRGGQVSPQITVKRKKIRKKKKTET